MKTIISKLGAALFAVATFAGNGGEKGTNYEVNM